MQPLIAKFSRLQRDLDRANVRQHPDEQRRPKHDRSFIGAARRR